MKVNKDIKLRRIRVSDAKDFFEITGDKEVNKFLSYPLHKSSDDTKFVIKNIFKKEKGPYSHTVIVMNKKVIGEVGLKKRNEGYELGYQLNRKYWGKGVMTKVITSLLNNFFKKNPSTDIYVTAYKDNKRSRALFQKFPFRKTNIKTYTFRNEKNDDGTFMWKIDKKTWTEWSGS